MARNNITDYSTDPTSNTDIGGVGIGDSDSAKNMRDGEQQMMAALARMNAGTAPLNDTFRVRNADDTSKTAGLSTENMPTGTDRDLNVEMLYRYGAPKETRYTSSGTHTFADTTKYFELEAVGGGGGGGGVNGIAGSSGAGSGGWSGVYGKTGVLSRGGAPTGSITIGTGGAGGVGSDVGSSGGHTIWTDIVNGAITWPGGPGGRGVNAGTNGTTININDAVTVSSPIIWGITQPNPSYIQFVGSPPGVRGGHGGSTQLGTGGTGSPDGTGTANTGGDAPSSGYGGGGGGAAARGTDDNARGGNGRPGILIVREW